MQHRAPPPVIDTAQVLEFACVDADVRWTGRMKLFVNDQQLGPVPLLVLAQSLMKPRGEVFLLCCDEDWNVLGSMSDATVEDAKQRAERYYEGVSQRWVAASATAQEIEHWFRETPGGQAYVCSFCNGIPPSVDGLFGSKSAAIWASLGSPDTSISMMWSGGSDGQSKTEVHGRVQA